MNSEERALSRAVTLLLVVSLVRWGWAATRPANPTGDNVLPGLLSESREATEEAAERSTPLRGDERVDPNRADEIQLDRLPGVGPVTARSIVHARDSGVVFRRVEDLLVVRGVGPGLLAQVGPFLDLSVVPPRPPGRRMPGVSSASGLIDINRAGVERLQDLPGVGPAIAARIIEERGKQMFQSVDDLVRVGGLGAVTVERLRSFATVGRGP